MSKVYVIRLGSINKIMGFDGDVYQDSKIKHQFDKEHPFIPGKRYQFIRFYFDELEVKVVVDAIRGKELRNLLDTGSTNDELRVQWPSGVRIITTQDLPQIPPLRSIVSFKCESVYTAESAPLNVLAWIDNSINVITEKEIRMTI
jgi:hypothetical protein